MIDITGEIMENPGVQGLGGELPGQVRFGVPGPPGAPFTYDDFTVEQLKALTGPAGKDGRSIYELKSTLYEPEEPAVYYRFARSLIITNGREPQVGDLVISNNGILGVIYTFVEDDAADAVIRPIVKLSGEDGALRFDCVITSDLRPPFISTWGENPSINFSVVSGSLTTVWNKINRGEQPNVLFRYLGETEGDVFNYFMEADYVEHFGYGSTPVMLRMNFIGNNEIITLTSSGQADITNNRITSYTVSKGVGQPGEKGDPGTPGFSIYYMDKEEEYPYEGFKTFNISKIYLSNSGSGVKVGDLLVSSNGVLCNVTSVSANIVGYNPVAKISSDGKDGKDGFSVYSSSVILFVNIDAVVSIDPDSINTYGREIQIGDHIISSNGFIGVVTSFTSSGHPNVKILADLKGAKGDNYVLTDSDKTDIANTVLNLLPTWTGGSY